MAIVEVYWNIRKQIFSVRSHGKVIKHTDYVLLRDVTWIVQQGGRARVIRQGRKNVHAWAKGKLVATSLKQPGIGGDGQEVAWNSVYYNPYKDDRFWCYVGDQINKLDASHYAILRTEPNWVDHQKAKPAVWAGFAVTKEKAA